MAVKIDNPLPEPEKRPHRPMEFPIRDVDKADEEKLMADEKEDDFDLRIMDDDDFDVE